MGGAGRTGLATAALWLALGGAAMAATPPATVITDPTGDANGLGNLGLNQATGPVSDGTHDLTAVKLSTDRDALRVVFEQSTAPDPAGPLTFTMLRFNLGDCAMQLGVLYGTLDHSGNGAPVTLADSGPCTTDGFNLSGFGAASIEGKSLVARFPFADLAKYEIPVAPGKKLTQLSANTRIGTMVFVSCDPVPCDQLPPDVRYRRSSGPFIDTTAAGTDYTVSSDSRRAGSRRTGRR